jgi:hypothetical protein
VGGWTVQRAAGRAVLTSRRSPLQNRVDPFGEIHATPHRGGLFGNRGGRFHNDDRTLTAARWKSKRWIVCLCDFKGRRKEVFGPRYTDLFFLDEPTALAAGHRPCFECRRDAAVAYRQAVDPRLSADEIDARLDSERRDDRAKRLHLMPVDDLPDGALYAEGGMAFAVAGDIVLRWSFTGYTEALPRPRETIVFALTPPTSIRALANGYRPLWRASAGEPDQVSSSPSPPPPRADRA